jgi:superfamily I DNA/RNA helicase
MNLIEDERCIAFVAISRARKQVYLSMPENYKGAEMVPSRFINEIGLQDKGKNT